MEQFENRSDQPESGNEDQNLRFDTDQHDPPANIYDYTDSGAGYLYTGIRYAPKVKLPLVSALPKLSEIQCGETPAARFDVDMALLRSPNLSEH